jgi:putative zinc finger protein
MSHVADGTLHAYLDGELSPAEVRSVDAHLAQCPDCHTRLAEERALIARADELLGLAAPPDRAVPPFRPGDATPPLRRQWRVRWPLAWAATVVLALGIGMYLGRGSAPPARQSVAAEEARGRKHASPAAAVPRPPLGSVADRSAVAESTRPADSTAAFVQRQAATGLSLDSARAVLDHDPVVVPGAAIRAIREQRAVGYRGTVVVIEQQLDASTVIELVEGLPAATNVAAPAARAVDRYAPTESLARAPSAAARREKQARVDAATLVEEEDRPVRLFDHLQVRISGPLPLDSLKQLLQRVQPVKR